MKLSELTSLPTTCSLEQNVPPTKRWGKPLATLLFSLLLTTCYFYPPISVTYPTPDSVSRPICAQAEPITPSFDLSSIVKDKKSRIVSWLGDAVKIPTEIFDVMGPIGEDYRWDVFYKFADYLEGAFPLTHQHLTRTRVVTHALVFEWEGSDSSLKPLLLTGHQDVVPVLNATRSQWSHDPFGGEFDGTYIWGRGSVDDKSGVLGILSAVELLLEADFKPTRSVILAFGIDEETGGKVGAYHLGQWIEEKYGKDSMAMLVDEGNGMVDIWGQLFAAPAVGEKGYLDVDITVETLGGHSSVPQAHTGIGYISLLIAELEKNPHAPYLNAESPLVGNIACAAEYGPEAPSSVKRAVKKVSSSGDKKALKELQDWFVEGSSADGTLMAGLGKAMVSTTQAVDIINGGVKVNALPEVVSAVVNHRISVASSVKELQKHLIKVLSPVAAKYDLSLEAFGKNITSAKSGKVILSEAYHSALDPAPVSPYTVDSAAWRLLSGTVKGVYNTRPAALIDAEEAKKTVHMAPSLSTGNTDTKRYWNLTRNIYRFAYQTASMKGVHTVDERNSADDFVEQVRWFANFIVNVDESREI